MKQETRKIVSNFTRLYQKVKIKLSFFNSFNWNRIIPVCIILLGVFWFSVTALQYKGFAYRTGDTPVAEQAIWNTVHGRIFYQSFLGTDTNLREHLNFIQVLYLPFYALVPHTLTLFFIIQLSMILGAIFLFIYARKKFGTLAGALAAGIFVFNPITASQAVGDMHVVSVAAAMFLMLLISYHEKRYKHFLFWTVAMVLVSEFVAPTVALVGVLAFLERRNWKWYLPPLAGGIGLYMAAKYYITIGFGSNDNILSKFKLQALMSIYKIEKRLDLVREALAPLLWIFPWLSKYSLLLIPSLLIALVIIIPGRIGGGNHVFILIPPVMAMIFIDLLERFGKYRKYLLWIAAIGIIFSLHPWYKLMEIDASEYSAEMSRAVEAVKDGGSLTSSTQFGPNLCRREEYFLPFNDKMTDYVVLKTSKITKKTNELEDQELKYDQVIERSGLYRTVFREGRIVVFVKKEKVAEILGVSLDVLEGMSDEELAGSWKKAPSR